MCFSVICRKTSQVNTAKKNPNKKTIICNWTRKSEYRVINHRTKKDLWEMRFSGIICSRMSPVFVPWRGSQIRWLNCILQLLSPPHPPGPVSTFRRKGPWWGNLKTRQEKMGLKSEGQSWLHLRRSGHRKLSTVPLGQLVVLWPRWLSWLGLLQSKRLLVQGICFSSCFSLPSCLFKNK